MRIFYVWKRTIVSNWNESNAIDVMLVVCSGRSCIPTSKNRITRVEKMEHCVMENSLSNFCKINFWLYESMMHFVRLKHQSKRVLNSQQISGAIPNVMITQCSAVSKDCLSHELFGRALLSHRDRCIGSARRLLSYQSHTNDSFVPVVVP